MRQREQSSETHLVGIIFLIVSCWLVSFVLLLAHDDGLVAEAIVVERQAFVVLGNRDVAVPEEDALVLRVDTRIDHVAAGRSSGGCVQQVEVLSVGLSEGVDEEAGRALELAGLRRLAL